MNAFTSLSINSKANVCNGSEADATIVCNRPEADIPISQMTKVDNGFSRIMDLRQAYVSLLLLSVFCVACTDRDLRGRFSKSKDGKTYLAVTDDNGGQCGPLTVDGKEWAKPINQPREIKPGNHVIECGVDLNFTIPAGVIYEFNYWGP